MDCPGNILFSAGRFALCALAMLLSLPGCQSPCGSDAWVFDTDDRILGHRERLQLCPSGVFHHDVRSDIRASINGVAIDTASQGTFRIEASDRDSYTHRVVLAYDGDIERVFYLVNTDDDTYLIPEEWTNDLDGQSPTERPSGLRLQ